MSASASDDGEQAAAMDAVVEEALQQKCEGLEQKIKNLKLRAIDRGLEEIESISASVKHWNMKEAEYKKEIEDLKEKASTQSQELQEVVQHKKNMRTARKDLLEEYRTLKNHDAAIWQENEDLRNANAALVEDNTVVHQANEEIAAETSRVIHVLVASQARHNRTFAAVSKIVAEQKEATAEEGGTTETERTVIDHCLRQLTKEERGKFLCECGSLDGGFIFRNQIRREMDAIVRDPKRLAELLGDEVDTESMGKTLHDAIEGTGEEFGKGPSQEVQKKEKRRKKGSRKH